MYKLSRLSLKVRTLFYKNQPPNHRLGGFCERNGDYGKNQTPDAVRFYGTAAPEAGEDGAHDAGAA